MSAIDLFPLVVVAVAVSIASVTDLWMFKVHDILTLPLLAAGLLASSWLWGWSGLGTSLLGVALGFGLLVIPRAFGGVGAGDLKLTMAIGAWLGPYLSSEVFLASALFQGVYAAGVVWKGGGVLGLAVELIAAKARLLGPGSWRAPTSNIEAEVLRADRRRRLVPFAAMTCLGFFATLAWHGRDLGRVWPPHDRDLSVSTASTTGLQIGWGRDR